MRRGMIYVSFTEKIVESSLTHPLTAHKTQFIYTLSLSHYLYLSNHHPSIHLFIYPFTPQSPALESMKIKSTREEMKAKNRSYNRQNTLFGSV